MTVFVIIVLLLLGFGLILIEFLLTPGFVVGLLGLGCIIYAIYFAYDNLVAGQAHIFLGIAIVAGIFMVVKLFNGDTYNRIANNDIIKGKMNQRNMLNLSVGQEGLTLSALRPSGNALFNDIKVEVNSESDFVYTNTKIYITKIEQDKIFVKPL